MIIESGTDLFRINGIRERDIDLLLLEEFGSSDLEQAKTSLEKDIGKIQRWQPEVRTVG